MPREVRLARVDRLWIAGAAAIVAIALTIHAPVPRYEWRGPDGTRMIRIDRWTGKAEVGRLNAATGGRWVAFGEGR